MDQYLKQILTARVYDVARETPLEYAPGLSRRLGQRVYLKREDLQPIFSFKVRGAYNKMVRLPEETWGRGVIASSAGNHAQGVALGARTLGIKAVIVMPRTTPAIKVASVRALGAKAVLHGDTYEQAQAHAQLLMQRTGATFVHPYDDPDVIAGQGTVAMEILRQANHPPHAILIPVGGGGLIAGMGTYVKALLPTVRIIGVEPEDAATLATALQAGRRTRLKEVGIFADGVAVRMVGREPFRLAKKYVDEVITVTTDEICAAIKDIFDDTRGIAEPAGALGVAGAKKYVARGGVAEGSDLVAVISGANTNFDRLRHVAERANVGERREALLAVTIPERPGSFRQFCRAIGKRAVTEFNYRYAGGDDAHVFVGLAIEGGDAEKDGIVAHLTSEGYAVDDLTDNDLAKTHVRYMVGGRTDKIPGERVFRFRFPERPGALLSFLNKMGNTWNISMFHYRNHGAAYGRVLIGLQIPAIPSPQGHLREHQRDPHAALRRFLDATGFSYFEESTNPAYRLFLA